MRLRILAAALLLPVAAARAPALAAVQAPDPAHRARALELAKLAQPRELLLSSIMAQTDRHFVSVLGATPEGQEMEADYPGIIDAMYRAARPELVQGMAAMIPAMWEEVADVMAARLTATDMTALETFYRSPTGRKMIEGAAGGIDMQSFFTEIAANPDKKVDGKDLDHVQSAAIRGAISTVNANDMAVLEALNASGAGAKLVALTPELEKIMLEQANRPDPALEARMQAAMTGAVEAHIAKAEAEAE